MIVVFFLLVPINQEKNGRGKGKHEHAEQVHDHDLYVTVNDQSPQEPAFSEPAPYQPKNLRQRH